MRPYRVSPVATTLAPDDRSQLRLPLSSTAALWGAIEPHLRRAPASSRQRKSRRHEAAGNPAHGATPVSWGFRKAIEPHLNPARRARRLHAVIAHPCGPGRKDQRSSPVACCGIVPRRFLRGSGRATIAHPCACRAGRSRIVPHRFLRPTSDGQEALWGGN
jgi:hypothetical protein